VTHTHHEATRTTAFSLRGDVDMASAPQFHRALEAHAAFTLGEIVCDCTDLGFLDSTGIAMLVEVFDDLSAQGRGFRLVNVNGMPLRALQICGLLARFGLSPDGAP
jgi:anti-sigma B factor antagonist